MAYITFPQATTAGAATKAARLPKVGATTIQAPSGGGSSGDTGAGSKLNQGLN